MCFFGLVVTKKLGLKDGNPGVIDEKRNEIGSSERAPDVKKRKKRVKVDGVGAEQGRDRQGETVQPPFRRAFHPETHRTAEEFYIRRLLFYEDVCRCTTSIVNDIINKE